MKQAHVFVIGDVQGVGYRQFVRRLARKNAVNGWVKNLADGRVEGVLQGEEAGIQELLRRLKQGPFLAEVKQIDVQWEDISERLDSFEIVSS